MGEDPSAGGVCGCGESDDEEDLSVCTHYNLHRDTYFGRGFFWGVGGSIPFLDTGSTMSWASPGQQYQKPQRGQVVWSSGH